MASKYYAVRKGRKVGIFNSWAECQLQIKGFSGAEYKSFTSLEDANAFLTMNQKPANKVEYPDSQKAVAYVDGSYNVHTKEYSYGAVLLHDGKEQEFSHKGTDLSMAEMRNVAGEIHGAEAMMDLCVSMGIKELDLYYDYEGIEKWCTGVWKAKKPGTIAYANHYQEIKEKLVVNFYKVAAHTGVELNERVDQLAKAALGILS